MPLNVEFGYTENIELPIVAERKSVTVVMPILVDYVIETLDNLKAAGAQRGFVLSSLTPSDVAAVPARLDA